jgi:hypothetical protein
MAAISKYILKNTSTERRTKLLQSDIKIIQNSQDVQVLDDSMLPAMVLISANPFSLNTLLSKIGEWMVVPEKKIKLPAARVQLKNRSTDKEW